MRFDLRVIDSWIKPGSKVIGLGCGEGELLAHLKEDKQVRETGIEIVEQRVVKCIEKGLSVIQGDINEEVHDYPDNTFDYVILSQTLQQVYDPLALIHSMLRIGKKVIVSFPNFGHWHVRLQILFTGHAPVTPQLPYTWYGTPNIRVLSIKDFREFASEVGFSILEEVAINTDKQDKSGSIVKTLPNLRATYGIFLISKR
ncbi:MAG: methionine biosynthesis protein MetW [Desulfobacteraceae bacterium]|nr:methionine biosynthesis protein MetW [Desulfobacteraceae bacterium]MCF8094171.1 methionine biosynthesis protein MetW [Desulfobacteraceae bacterium]